jgi:hypothetical protein
MVCEYCGDIYGCESASPGNTCPKFTFHALPNSRERLLTIVTTADAVDILRRTKMVTRPEHPNTTAIKEMVGARDTAALNALIDPSTMPLPYLVMAASHLLGDSKKVGDILRGAEDKRETLVNILLDIAASMPAPVPAEDNPLPAEDNPLPAEDNPPEPTKKRRRRNKAQIAADEAAAAAAKNSACLPEDAAPLSSPQQVIDFDRAFGDILSAIAAAGVEQAGSGAVLKRIALDQGRDLEMIIVRQTKIMNALRALESQLLMTGMVLDTEISGALED